MLSIYKLEKLSRNHRLRKIASIFSAAERCLCSGAVDAHNAMLQTVELNYFSEIAQHLSNDTLFSQSVRDVFVDATEIFRSAAASGESGTQQGVRTDAAALRRTLNSARHLLLAETGRSQADWDFFDGDGRLDPEKRRVFSGMRVYFEDIRSPFNVGAMFRSAESFGVEKIFLSLFSADPLHVRAQRTAMGCVDVLPWERRDLFSSGAELPCPIFALETGGIPLPEFPFPRQGLLIAGSEELGVSPPALAAADASLGRVSIPCYGAKGSLNVSVAFGIVIQAWAQAIG